MIISHNVGSEDGDGIHMKRICKDIEFALKDWKHMCELFLPVEKNLLPKNVSMGEAAEGEYIVVTRPQLSLVDNTTPTKDGEQEGVEDEDCDGGVFSRVCII